MTPRERILAALDHREPDRVPIDLGATASSGISAIAHARLVRHLGLAGVPTRVYDVVQQLARPGRALLDRYGVDVVDLGETFNTEPSDWYGVSLDDGLPAEFPAWFRPRANPDGSEDVFDAEGTRIATRPVGATFFDQTCYPWVDGYPADLRHELAAAMRKVHWAALAISPWDHAAENGFWTKLRANCLRLRSDTDQAIMMLCGCNLFEWGTFLRRIDNFLLDLADAPKDVERLLDALVEIHLDGLGHVIDAVGDIADIIRVGDDLGTDLGPFMSPETYRRLFKPRHREICAFIKSRCRAKILLHSCGSIYLLIPDLIEAGFDILNPVQVSARDMEPARLKREFGRSLVFWGGGCDTRRVLNRAVPAEVRRHVREQIDTFAPGGGFVFNTVHNILPDVPPQNIEAMFDEVLRR